MLIRTAFPPEDWKRLPGRPRITWMNTILYDLESHNLTLTEAVNMAQNRPLWSCWLRVALRTLSGVGRPETMMMMN